MEDKQIVKVVDGAPEYQKKMSWGGETKNGYIHYELPNGEKVTAPLRKK